MPPTPYQPSLLNLASLTPDPVAGLERFESAAWQVDDLFANVPFHIAGSVLEPCSGHGALTKPLRERGLTVITNDIDPRVAADMHYDTRDPNALWPGRDFSDMAPVDWVITNPPFSLAVPIFLNMVNRARLGVIFQHRITFAEPTIERDQLFAEYKPNGMIVMMRYSFLKDGGTDSATTAWFVWLTGNPPLHSGATGYQVFSKYAEFFRIARRHST